MAASSVDLVTVPWLGNSTTTKQESRSVQTATRWSQHSLASYSYYFSLNCSIKIQLIYTSTKLSEYCQLNWTLKINTDCQHSSAFLHYSFFILLGQSGTLLGLWRGYYRSGGPCTGASIPCFLFYLCNMQTANWRASICSGRSWRSLLPWGLLQVDMSLRWELKIITRFLTYVFLPQTWP